MSADIDPVSVSITYQSPDTDQKPPDLRLLHYNDVYHIEEGSAEPIGGISRFQAVANHYRSDAIYTDQPKLITLFSGDAYNPSIESSVSKGSHMVPILNNIGTDAACVGNHDLDFGVAQFRHLRNQCNFPWLLANVLDPALGEDHALADCQRTTIIEASNGIKVGLIGLGEREWLDTINSLPPNLIYLSASETAKKLIPDLRAQGAEIIIALTHMREPNDIKLAEKTPPGFIDIILGGHDHFYAHHLINNTHVLRSGTDFKQLSYISAWRKPDSRNGWNFTITRRNITRSIPPDPHTITLAASLTSSLATKLHKPIGYTAVPLDARFTTVRTRESNLGNFICDLMRHYYDTDCALIASGTIRGDQIYPPGIIRVQDLLNCFPFEDPVVVLRLRGSAIRAALENSVSGLPALEGRFPQVSNLTFSFDPVAPPGARVRRVSVHDRPLDPAQMYTMATRGYMSRGHDGYVSLLGVSAGGEAEEVVSEENGLLLSMMLRQYFMSLKVLGKWARWSPSLHRHWGGVHRGLHAEGRVRGGEAARVPAGKGKGKGEGGKVWVEGRVVDSDTEDEEVVDGERHPQHHHHQHQQLLHHGGHGRAQRMGLHRTLTFEEKRVERERHVMRKYVRRWKRLVGIGGDGIVGGEGGGGMVGEHTEEWSLPHWTRGIAPRVEGRIVVEIEGGW